MIVVGSHIVTGVCIAAGRLIWMIPPADQPSSQDTHIPVANPNDHEEPVQHTDSQPHMHPGTDSAQCSADAAGDEGASYHRIGFGGSGEMDHGVPTSKMGQTAGQAQPILLDVQKECFSRLLLLPEMITDHLPETYLAAVQQL